MSLLNAHPCFLPCPSLPSPSSRPRLLRSPRLTLSPPSSRPHVGTPPSSVSRGRLRRDIATRYLPPPPPPPLESRATTSWQRANSVSRSLSIWTFIARLYLANWTHDKDIFYVGGRTEEKLSNKRRKLATFAREQMLTLGPTMVKVGQLASTRADLLPKEVIEELRLLQDRVPAFRWDVAEDLLKEAYGDDLEKVFLWLEKVPIAAASLGQVYRGRLRNGDEVVVKVQRPGLKKLFDLDLWALKVVAEGLQRSKKWGGKDKDWVGIYEECAKVLYEEIDYERELRSCRTFGDNFRNAGVDFVRVPKVYEDFTTRTVLCLEYVPGIKISDKETLEKAGMDTKLVAQRVATAFVQQVLEFAFFSSDPHPGNCAVGADETIIFYDFGMMGSLNPTIKERLVDILVGVLDKDAQVVMDALVELEALVLPADPTPVRRAIQYFLDQTGKRPDRDQTVAAIGDDLYATAYDKPFRLPAASIFLLRAFSTLEAIAKGLDNDFRFADVALPFADDILNERTGGPVTPQRMARGVVSSALTGKTDQVTEELRRRVVGAGNGAMMAVGRIEKMEKTLAQLENGDLKLKARSVETEKLLRRQYSLTESSNYLVSSGATALAATQLYSAGSVEPAALMAALSAVLGFVFLRKQKKLSEKDRFSN